MTNQHAPDSPHNGGQQLRRVVPAADRSGRDRRNDGTGGRRAERRGRPRWPPGRARPRSARRSSTRKPSPTPTTGSRSWPATRVKVAFAPRRSDRWQVDGVAPRALPPGRLTGKAIRQSPTAPKPVPNAWHGRAGSSPDGRPDDGDQRTDRSHRFPIADSDRRRQRRTRRRRRSGRSAPRGLWLPAVLGADRQLDPARLGEALDHRLLRVGAAAERRPRSSSNSDGSTTVGWSGWTSSKLTGGHQRRPRQRRAGRPDRPELRLDLGRRDPPEGAAGQLGRPRQPRPPDRGRGARPRRRRRQPRLRADRLGLRRRVHRAGQVDPRRAQQGRTRAIS